MLDIKESFTSLDLLPQSKSTIINCPSRLFTILELYENLLKISIESFNAYLENQYHLFDAHVGDTLCQIRAYFFSNLKSNHAFHSVLKDVYQETINCYDNTRSILADLNKLKNKNRWQGFNFNESFDLFFKKQKLVYKIDSCVMFLISAYLLSKYKLLDDDDISIAIDYHYFMSDFKLSKYLAKRVIHYFQKNTSSLSTNYILTIAKTIYNDHPIQFLILNQLCQLDDEGRTILPAYEVMKVIYLHAKKQNKYFLIYLPQHNYRCIYHVASDKLAPYIYKHFAKKQMVNIHGLSKTLKCNNTQTGSFIINCNRLGFKNILLANNVSHPQYPGKKLVNISINPYAHLMDTYIASGYHYKRCLDSLINDYNEKRNFALLYGCNQHNTKLFLIKHVYCSNIDDSYIQADSLSA